MQNKMSLKEATMTSLADKLYGEPEEEVKKEPKADTPKGRKVKSKKDDE